MHAEFADQILMIRSANGRKNDLCEVTRLLDIGRQAVHGGVGPDRAESLFPWIPTFFTGHKLPWLLFATFKGESWIHCLPSSAGFLPTDRLTGNKDLQALVVSFDTSENRTLARLYKKGNLVAELAAAGKGDVPLEVISFKSSAHPKTVLKRCKTVRQAVEAFCAAVDARLRDLTASSARGKLEFQDSRGRDIKANELDELEVTCYAPVTSAESPASVRLKSAIEIGDPDAARQALADGASVEFLPDFRVSPLSIALNYRCPGDWVGVSQALVEAGAPIDGYEWEDPPIFSWIGPLAQLSNKQGVIKGLEATLALGADINCPARTLRKGSTPLHFAVNSSFPALVEFFVSRGARLDARDADGLTPLKLAERLARNDPPVDLAGGAEEDGADDDEPDRKLTLLEFIIANHGGNPEDEVRRRARVVQVLRRATPSKPTQKKKSITPRRKAAKKKKKSRG